MKKLTITNYIFLWIISVLFISCNSEQNKSEVSLIDNSFDEKVDSILSLMTLEEKIGQLNLPSSGEIVTGLAKNSNIAQKIEEGKV